MPERGFNGVGRPGKDDSLRRKGIFLALMAEGHDAVAARKKAGIHPDRALRIVTESGFLEIVQALRAGTAVVGADDDRIAA
jgi:hypothetical protein